jgi:Flp pilus assembly CpaF family ATPase
MNTSHDGSILTVHANSAWDALTQVENMVQMGHVNLTSRAIRQREDRVQAYILVCFLAFVLWKSLEMRQSRAGLGNV